MKSNKSLKTKVMSERANEILDGLKQFNGSETIFQIPLLKTKYTDGIKYLAEAAQCFWLVTDASVIAKSLQSKSYFITIDIKRFSEQERGIKKCDAIVTYSDGNDVLILEQKYGYTDFPLEELRLFFVDDTLMLPGEY
jgi:hypothetical protein